MNEDVRAWIQAAADNTRYGSDRNEDQPYEEVTNPPHKPNIKDIKLRKTAKNPTKEPANDHNDESAKTFDPRKNTQHAKNSTARDITAEDTNAKDSNGSNYYPLVDKEPAKDYNDKSAKTIDPRQNT